MTAYVYGKANGEDSFAWHKLVTPPRVPHADPAVEALLQAAWDGNEPLNAYDDAEAIVAIVRAAIERHPGA